MKQHLATLILALTALTAYAQGTVKGFVFDAKANESIPFANIRIIKNGQKAPVTGSTSDTEGQFIINKIPYGTYQLQVSYVGYKTATQTITLSKSAPTANLGRIQMESSAQTLNEATVTGQRTSIKLEVDRKSYNVAQDLSNVGASASEALENIPSVEVDQDGNISLRGSSSVEVWINGKASGLTSENRGTILEQIPAESIDRIEVIDNPGAKYSAEGSAGIINIVLKRDARAGYYGSAQVGANTAGGANANFNINYNSKWWDANLSIGYRHRQDENGSLTEQTMFDAQGLPYRYQDGHSVNTNRGNNLFTRGGITLHASTKDEITLSGNIMKGGHKNYSNSPYYYGDIAVDGQRIPTHTLYRNTHSKSDMFMYNAELDYRHTFREGHFLNLHANHGAWNSDNANIYRDSTELADPLLPPLDDALSWQSRPQEIRNNWTSVKLDYENRINEHLTLQTGYNGDFHHENTPQESYENTGYLNGEETDAYLDKLYYNRFVYDSQVHALYANATMKWGLFGIQAGLRGEYWNIDTESFNYEQDHTAGMGGMTYKKDYFQLFPSLFLSYQLTENDQLQVNYTRRLQRPWGGELNSFMDTREANSVRFGNPKLTPEYSNSFSLNYLKTFSEHSFLVSAFYRPTTSVKQHVSYTLQDDSRMFNTSLNMGTSTSTGGEVTLKNKFWHILDLTTTASAYYYHLNEFNGTLREPLKGQNITLHTASQSRFTWNIKLKAAVNLPYDWSIQATGEYRSRQALAQGYRHPAYGIDMGIKKSFLQKRLTLSANCRDLLDSRKFISTTETATFHQYAKRWRHARKFNFTLTWTFGNNKPKRRPMEQDQQQSEDDFNGGYE